MAYDEKLAERIRADLKGRKGLKGKKTLEEKKMFGGLAFMLKGRMCCGISKDSLMVRVVPEKYESMLQKPHAAVMDFTGRALKGFLFVRPDGYDSDAGLSFWLDRAVEFADSKLPKKENVR
jgi:TfoX/Sxy family transcriptional regulator of competence genes